ncbi:MAG: NAD-dependent epimerase/dehydratase family protein [Puniceicoccales bacterium]|jgi:UDP-glucose 4-epimerase|nr:NAD-dependent epimerase/dehydratase family protein [Puniceicoccales bacterium]
MTILVTGGAGFIGSHIAEHFQGRAHVRVLDNLRTGHRRNLDGLDVEFIEGSVTDRAAVERAVAGADYVFHLAALVSVPESMSAPRECAEINVLGHLNVLEAAAAAGARKLVFASSAAVYGYAPATPTVETATPEPRSPYAITKLDGEYYNALFTREGRLETASIRFFNVFGPRQDPKGAYAAAVPIFIKRALRGEMLSIFGDGGQTRDFIFVKDIVGALVFAAQTPGVTGVFNAGYGVSTSVGALAEKIVALTGGASRVEHLPERAGDVRHSLASAAKLRAAGWHPAHTFDEGLAETVRWFAANRPGSTAGGAGRGTLT